MALKIHRLFTILPEGKADVCCVALSSASTIMEAAAG